MKVAIVNAHASVAQGLALLLKQSGQFHEVEVFEDLDSLFSGLRSWAPELVAVDAGTEDLDYARLVGAVRALNPAAGVAILSDDDDPTDMRRAVQAGARAYLSLTGDSEELVREMQVAASGHLVISGQVTSRLQGSAASLTDEHGSDGETEVEHNLSERELEVLRHLARGMTNTEIADALVITENTIKVHVGNILRKLDLRNRQQAAAYALQNGLVARVDFYRAADTEASEEPSDASS